MKVEQFHDKGLSHFSYAVLSNKEVVLIDPARDPRPYYKFAKENDATIAGVIETHPHADFVSSHLEIHQDTGATIYTSYLVGAEYPHQVYDHGNTIGCGDIILEAIHTPGHSPDSISVLLIDSNGKEHCIFTGDTLFVGDVGRPDLRENVGGIRAKAKKLARQLYHSTRERIMTLPEDVIVLPAHGAGSLCGKNIQSDSQSTIGKEMKENPALQEMSEDEFVALITNEQPRIPKYFQYNVTLNKAGADPFEQSIRAATNLIHSDNLIDEALIVDTRTAEDFKKGHLPNAINIPDSPIFETWLGSIIAPGESFYLIGYTEESVRATMEKTAKIGYEKFVNGLLWDGYGTKQEPDFSKEEFDSNPSQFTVIDIREDNEIKDGKTFSHAIHIPLSRLREAAESIPKDKPVVVHCAGGARSAIGSSILSKYLQDHTIFDMGTFIKTYKK